MKIAMINASPRLLIRKNDVSASYTILQDMRRQLRREHAHDFEDFHVKTASMGSEDIKRLMSCDVWLFSFPVYAGGLPSHLLTFLTQIEELCGQKNILRLRSTPWETAHSMREAPHTPRSA